MSGNRIPEKLKQLPFFRYHPNPFETGSFEEGKDKICPCCGKATTVVYSTQPYCRADVADLCPDCIASGKVAEKYDALCAIK